MLKIALSHFKIIIRVQTLLHPVPSTSIVHTFMDYSSTSKLCAWLFGKSNNNSTSSIVYASGNATPN